MVMVIVKDISWTNHRFEVLQDGQESIVDLAEEQGIELPYSCRSGACFSCCAQIKQWAEFLDREKTGEQLIDVDEDEFLCCIGGIQSSAFESGEEVTIELEMLN